jgi:hypothetical protein
MSSKKAEKTTTPTPQEDMQGWTVVDYSVKKKKQEEKNEKKKAQFDQLRKGIHKLHFPIIQFIDY